MDILKLIPKRSFRIIVFLSIILAIFYTISIFVIKWRFNNTLQDPTPTPTPKEITINVSSGPLGPVVKFFYATDREPELSGGIVKTYGIERSETNNLALGIGEVSIPSSHQMGVVELPSLFSLEFQPNPDKHFTLKKMRQLSYDAFYEQMRNTVNATNGKEAFVFIHGYNVSFEDAALRTAQLAFDLWRSDNAKGYDVTPILYSWPSQGEIKWYTSDEAAVEWSAPHLRWFLEDVAVKSGAPKIHLIAHSMGNRALTNALRAIATESRTTPMPKFRQVVLAAPDIDVGVFQQLADVIQRNAEKVTLYASSGDEPIKLSRKFHKYRRVGEGGPNTLVLSGIDSIDASPVTECFFCLGHSYFAENRLLLVDLALLLKSEFIAGKRPGLIRQKPGYYVFLR